MVNYINSAISRLGAGQPSVTDMFELIDAAAAGLLLVVERTPEALRRARLPERDSLIRQVRRRLYTHLPLTVAAKRMAAELADDRAVVDPEKLAALHRIVRLNAGDAPGWNTIYGVLRDR